MEVYKYDTHVHTSETSDCGYVEGADVVRLYKKAGYKGLVITDHYYSEYFEYMDEISWQAKINRYLAGYRHALAEGKLIGLNVLLGVEIRFVENPNDYLIYGIDEGFLKGNAKLYNMSLKQFRKLADENNLLIFQAHPFREGIVPADPLLLDGVEAYNGNPRHFSRNHLAASFAHDNNLKLISGSDFHRKQDLARGGVILPAALATSADFVDIINRNRIVGLIKSD